MTLPKRKHQLVAWVSVPVLLVALGAGERVRQQKAAAARGPVQAPMFEVDPFWPKPLPNHWTLGAITGMWVDDQDHILVQHSPGSIPTGNKGMDIKPPFSEMCCAAAPPVLEFDPSGALIRSLGGPGSANEIPGGHGLTVDAHGNMWIGRGDSEVFKFDKDGKLLLQVGKPNARLRPGGGERAAGGRAVDAGGRGINDSNSLDMESFGRATKVVVDARTNDAFVSDGYINHRVVVMDADTGKFKRVWGAYGNTPDDTLPASPKNLDTFLSMELPSNRGGAHDPDGPPLQQFRNPVHCVMLSKDGLVYVCDRQGDRLQVFTKDGKFVKEAVILPKTMHQGSVWDVAFSSDPQQSFVYVADGENELIHVLRRDTLEEITAFGDGGQQAGQWLQMHVLATDSKGNIYTGEWNGSRVQKFIYKGMGPVAARYQGTPWPRR